MKIDISKITLVIIQDEKGSIEQKFEIGSACLNKMGKAHQTLILKKAKAI